MINVSNLIRTSVRRIEFTVRASGIEPRASNLLENRITIRASRIEPRASKLRVG